VVPVTVGVVAVVLAVEVVVADVVLADVVLADVVVGDVVAVCDVLVVALPDAFARVRGRDRWAAWVFLGAGAVVCADESADVTEAPLAWLDLRCGLRRWGWPTAVWPRWVCAATG
jgi:hypothetical protein